MVTERRLPFEKSAIYAHETLTFAYRCRALMNRNPFEFGTNYFEQEGVMLTWLNELLPAVDSYRATLRILKAAYERGEL